MYIKGSWVQADHVIGVEEKKGIGQGEEKGHRLTFTHTGKTLKVGDDHIRDTMYQLDNYD